MNELNELKEMLCKELKEYGKKGELTAGSLDVVDKLSHSIKNLDKVIEAYEGGEYSNGYPVNGIRGGRSYADGGYNDGYGSYARRRDSMGRYSREGYSRHGDMIADLRDLMQDAPDDRTRQEFQRFISKMESM